jgi:hypothetical protein
LSKLNLTFEQHNFNIKNSTNFHNLLLQALASTAELAMSLQRRLRLEVTRARSKRGSVSV